MVYPPPSTVSGEWVWCGVVCKYREWVWCGVVCNVGSGCGVVCKCREWVWCGV